LRKELLKSSFLGLLVAFTILPPEWCVAAPPIPGESAAAVSGERDLSRDYERQAKRDAIIGIESARALEDPYYLGRQWVEVETWREVGETERLLPGETQSFVTGETPRGPLTQRFAMSIERLNFDNENENFTPPSHYSLAHDVQIKINLDGADSRVSYVLENKTRKGKVIYRHVFNTSGIQSASKNSLLTLLLFKNGDVRNVMMAHTRLFQANQAIGGGPVPLALVDVIDATKEVVEPINPHLRLASYSALTKDNYTWDPSISMEMRKNLRYCDELYVIARPGEKSHVWQVRTMPTLLEPLKGHLALFRWRQKLLQCEKPFAELLLGLQNGIGNATQRPELMPNGNSMGEIMRTLSGTSFSQAFRRSPEPWVNHPLEMQPLGSQALTVMDTFVDHAHEFGKKVEQRSTYPIDPKALEAGTEEAKIQASFHALTDQARDYASEMGAIRSGNLSWIEKAAPHLKLPGLALAYLVLANVVIYNLPNSPFFHQVKLFDIGVVEGPMVPYMLKFWLVSLVGALTFFLAVPLTFAHFSEKILRRPTLRGVWQVGLSQTLATGWEAFSTFGLRTASLLMRSTRQAAANACAKVGITGIKGMLQAMRYGVSPKQYLYGSDLGSPTGGGLIKLVSGHDEGEDPASLASRMDGNRILSFHIAFYLVAERLRDLPGFPLESGFTAETLKRFLGETAFANLEERFVVIAGEVENALRNRPQSPNASVETMASVFRSRPEISDSLSHLAEPLRRSEVQLLKRIRSRGALERFWPKAAGNEALYLKYRRATASHESVDVIASQFKNDNATNIPTTGMAPGDDQFASLANPDMLVTGDSGFLGIMGYKAGAEQIYNTAGWIGMIPADEENYGQEAATALPVDMQSPLYIRSNHNVLLIELLKAKPATFLQSLGNYLSFTRDSGLFEATEALGKRITQTQLRNWKPVFYVGLITSVIGLLGDYHKLPEDVLAMHPAGMGLAITVMALTKTLLGEVMAFLTYRFAWSANAIGTKRETTEVRNNTMELFGILRDLGMACTDVTANGAPVANVERHFSRLEAFYEKHGGTLPPEIAAKTDVVERAHEAIIRTTAFPPIVTDRSEASSILMNQAMGYITTIIGTMTAGFAWAFSETVPWYTAAALAGGTYVFGKTLQWVGGNLRAKFSYDSHLVKLRTALTELKREDSPAHREKLFKLVMQTALTYKRYGKGDVFDTIGLDVVTKQSNLLKVGEAMYLTMLESPPTKNRTIHHAIRRERGTAFCADLLAGSKTE